MDRMWNREVLRYVDSWACREGCPGNEEDERRASTAEQEKRDIPAPFEPPLTSGWDGDLEQGLPVRSGVSSMVEKESNVTEKRM